jgi:hypothetical protein
MGSRARFLANSLIIGATVLLVAVAIFPRLGAADVGDTFLTVDIPTAALCGGTIGGTTVSIVPGGKMKDESGNHLANIPILLVTSCVVSGQAKLFFLDPLELDLTKALKKTLTTTVTPSNGWESLAFRSDKGDLLGCGMVSGQPTIYRIDFIPFSPFDGITDGTAVALGRGPTGSTCKGVTWDLNDKSVYGSTTGTMVNHIQIPSETPSQVTTLPLLGTVASGCDANTMTGVTVSGSSLFVACSSGGQSRIRQLNKTSGLLVRTFSGPDFHNPGDIECDPVSFGISENKDVFWLKDQSTNEAFAVEAPFGSCAPVPPPAICPTGDLDSDGDALLDCWEDPVWWSDGRPGIALNGVYTTGGAPTNRFTLCVPADGTAGTAQCASKLHKDVFVEMDYMQFHKPNVLDGGGDSVSDVITAFANAPVTNPDGTSGVRLHVQVDEQLPHVNRISLGACTGPPGAGDVNFDAIKNGTAFSPPQGGFGTASERSDPLRLDAKRYVFHYGIFAHNQSPVPPATTTNSSGCAEILGNDFLVTLGNWANPSINCTLTPEFCTPLNPVPHLNVGTRGHRAATFMHELGHNLGLRHGGGDAVNCKPNYRSIMNYAYQMPSTDTNRPLDYSSQEFGNLTIENPPGSGIFMEALNAASLNEPAGVGGFAGKILFGPPTGAPQPKPKAVDASGAINWNLDTDSSDPTIPRDLTSMTSYGCPASPNPPGNPGTIFGFNDWANIRYNFKASTDFADGVGLTINPGGGEQEMTYEEDLEISLDTIDIKANDNKNSISVQTSKTVDVVMFSRPGVNPVDPGVDATTLDPATLVLRGVCLASPAQTCTGPVTWREPVKINPNGTFACNTRDVNGDSLPDFVCLFDLTKNILPRGLQRAAVEGTTIGEYFFHGWDFINVK